MIENDLLSAIQEFTIEAKESEQKKRYRAAVTLYFKALAVSCDLIIYRKIRKISSDHSERFRLLERHFPEIYKIIDEIFKYYTDTYSKQITKEYCEKMKGALLEIFRLGKIEGTD